ncbi:aggregation factor core [Jannaschia sp.]|nr:aggregation factor core [Jannaschia sp.]
MSRLAACLLLAATPAAADVVVTFDEGAPKDRFTIALEGDCALQSETVVIDLAPAPAGLIFDVTGSGAGIEVFQPFELATGQLARMPEVRDGDRAVSLEVTLAPSEAVAFTIDVDDTVSARGITVSGAEIAGAVVRVGAAEGRFGEDAVARVEMAACLS